MIPLYTCLLTPPHQQSLAATNAAIDASVCAQFLGQRVCIRALDSRMHSDQTIDQVIHHIRQTGTDRYDPTVVSPRYNQTHDVRLDFFALEHVIGSGRPILARYTWRRKLRPPVQIDLLIVYDSTRVRKIPYLSRDGKRTKHDGYIFINPTRRQEAVLAIIKIIR